MSLLPPLRAAAIACAWAVLLLVGTPGLDGIPSDALSGERARATYLRRMPDWTLPVAEAVVAFNREVRRPASAAFDALQRPLRVGQSWSLYLDGPRRCEKLEILVDGALRFRSNEPEHAWRVEVLKSAPIRAIVGGVASHPKGGGNWKGLTALVARLAREEDPAVREVVLRAMSGSWDQCGLAEQRRFVASAPDWEPRRP